MPLRHARQALVASLLAVALAVPAAVPVQARIRCDGPYQISGGASIRTPYCEDSYLAAVARSHGLAVSAGALHASVGTKRNTCQVVGRDIRVSEICNQVLPDHGGRPRFKLSP